MNTFCLILMVFISSTVGFAARPAGQHLVVLVDDHDAGGNTGEPWIFDDHEVEDLAIQPAYPSVLSVVTKTIFDKKKTFSILFEDPKDSELFKKVLTFVSDSYELQILKSDLTQVAALRLPGKLPNLIPFHTIRFQSLNGGAPISSKEFLMRLRGELQNREGGNRAKTENCALAKNSPLEGVSGFFNSIYKKISGANSRPATPVKDSCPRVAKEVIDLLEEGLTGFRAQMEEALKGYEPNHLGSTFLNYIKNNKAELENNEDFLKKAHNYVVSGFRYSRRKGLEACSHIHIDHPHLSRQELYQNILGFAECFAGKSDAETLLGTWGQANIERGLYNSYVDLVTTTYTPYSYIAKGMKPFPNPEELKTQFLLATSSTIHILSRFSGAFALLKSRSHSDELSGLNFLDIMVLIPEVNQKIGESTQLFQGVRKLKEVDQTFAHQLEKLETSLTLLQKALKQAKVEICADSKIREQILDVVPNACETEGWTLL